MGIAFLVPSHPARLKTLSKISLQGHGCRLLLEVLVASCQSTHARSVPVLSLSIKGFVSVWIFCGSEIALVAYLKDVCLESGRSEDRLPVVSYQWLINRHSGDSSATRLAVYCPCSDRLAWRQFTVTVWDSKYYLQPLSRSGGTSDCLSKPVPEMHLAAYKDVRQSRHCSSDGRCVSSTSMC